MPIPIACCMYHAGLGVMGMVSEVTRRLWDYDMHVTSVTILMHPNPLGNIYLSRALQSKPLICSKPTRSQCACTFLYTSFNLEATNCALPL